MLTVSHALRVLNSDGNTALSLQMCILVDARWPTQQSFSQSLVSRFRYRNSLKVAADMVIVTTAGNVIPANHDLLTSSPQHEPERSHFLIPNLFVRVCISFVTLPT
jgi:hypothetical protein